MRTPKRIAAAFVVLSAAAIAREPAADAVGPRAFTYHLFDALPDATATNPQGINARGDIVGSYTRNGVAHGFLLSEGALTTIDYPGAAFTDARGINARGDIVGTYRMPSEPAVNFHGYLRDKHGQLLPIDFPDHSNTIPQRITSTGLILGCRHDDDLMATMRGIVMNAHDLRQYGEPREYAEIDEFASMHNGATPDGDVIVGLYTDMDTNRGRGYLLYTDTFLPFDVPGSTFTAAWDVNPRGDIVGVYRDARGLAHGFVWSGLRFESLDVPGATATRAFGISANGVIVGNYTDAANRVHGFVAAR